MVLSLRRELSRALLQTFAAAEMGDAGERALHQATFGSRRCVINWTTSERADEPSPEARSKVAFLRLFARSRDMPARGFCEPCGRRLSWVKPVRVPQ